MPKGPQGQKSGHYGRANSHGGDRGNPDRGLVSTSYVEKHNQSMRQHMRRFTRLTNAHSKKFANHCAAQAMYFMYYNFVRINSAVKMSPAMAAGIETKLWEMTDLLDMVDA